MKCKTIQDYYEKYLELDVLLLADVFEYFRESSMEHYGLDPAHYYSVPGLSWDSMLKHTKIDIELITDEKMLFFYMEGIRGGLSVISKRYAKANNKYLENYDSNEKSTYLAYVDATNLYGNAMSSYVPYNEMKWCDQSKLDYLMENIMDIPDDNDVGYTIKCDIEYPQELHDFHNDYPFFPRSRQIKLDELSPYQLDRIGGKYRPTPKLIADLSNKTEIILDYRTLKQGLKHGLKLLKIHSAVQFNQKAWLKPYIDKNTELRKIAVKENNKFEADMFKLMNNAIYGKSIENVLKRQDIKFILDKKRKLKYIARPEFKSETIFSDNLVAIHLNKMEIKFNKPIYLGFTILELSKYVMFEFVYDYLKPKWGENITICGSDTDSLFIEINTDDFYNDIKDDIQKWFDTSNFADNNVFNIPKVNEKVLGTFKIETGSKVIKEFVGIRAKMYAFDVENDKCIIREKGVPYHKQENSIDAYKDVLFNDVEKVVEYQTIGSTKLVVSTKSHKKLAMKNFDDKRYILEDGINQYAFNHYKI